MGSFNVACSISKISIKDETDVYLFPLLFKGNNSLKGLKSFNNPYNFYAPFCFPIKGKYNNYGSIESIEKNYNTKIIEDYFGLSIEDFVEIVTDGSNFNIYDKYSRAFKVYLKDIDIFEKKYSIKEFLEHFGFIETDNCYELNGVTVNSDSYDEYQSKNLIINNEKISPYMDSKTAIGMKYQEITGIYLGISKEISKKVNILSTLTPMFVYGKVYDDMSEKPFSSNYLFKEYAQSEVPFPSTLVNWGFVLSKDSRDIFKSNYFQLKEYSIKSNKYRFKIIENGKEHDINSIKEFIDKWKELTGEELYFDSKKSFVEEQFENFQYLIDIERRNYIECFEEYEWEFNSNDFYSINRIEELRFFENWGYFEDLYLNSLDFLKNEYCKYCTFYWNMLSTNNFFFPAFSGEQYGNKKAELVFNQKLNKIIQEELMQEDDEY